MDTQAYYEAIKVIRQGAEQLQGGEEWTNDPSDVAISVAAAVYNSLDGRDESSRLLSELNKFKSFSSGEGLSSEQLLVARAGHSALSAIAPMFDDVANSMDEPPPQLKIMQAMVKAVLKKGQECGFGQAAK